MKKVSIVTVNYNQAELTIDLIDSLYRQEYSNIEIVVVDNGSKGNDAETIETQFPEIKVVKSNVNLGFAGGNNLGLSQVTGDFIFFVNNDTLIPNRTIMSLVRALESDVNIGAISPYIYYYDQPEILQYGGSTPINGLTGRNRSIGNGERLKMSDGITETSYIHGAAMMIRKDLIDEVGMMSENYFLYYEELDWVHRMKNAGYKVAVSRASFIIHKESMSTGKSSELKTYFQTRNRILFMRRNFRTLQVLVFLLFLIIFTVPKNLLKNALNGRYDLMRSFIAGIIWNLFHDKNSRRLGYKFDHLR